MGRRENEHYFEYRKCLITALKAHEVGTNSYMWSWNQKISGLVFVKPNIPALKYGRDMEIEAANNFIEIIKGKLTGIKLMDCGIFVDETLPYVGENPDRILMCSCCERICVETNCSYSVNYTK